LPSKTRGDQPAEASEEGVTYTVPLGNADDQEEKDPEVFYIFYENAEEKRKEEAERQKEESYRASTPVR